ncbi:hypothetical protein [Streptomyces sp. NPDC057582]|uniref:hypothetical protein n=1 Tax=Streptomyces sp. NPDC057582 TaxID=3346174 RepID=UPI0036BF3474
MRSPPRRVRTDGRPNGDEGVRGAADHHVTAVTVRTPIPALAGPMTIGLLPPVLIRLKLPDGMEADLPAGLDQVCAGLRRSEG